MEVPKPFLVIFCGIPCSGKSTLAKEVANILESKFNYSTVLVTSDTFRRMIPTYQYRFEPELEQFVRDATYEAILSGLKHGLLVISDDMNYYASIRRRLVRIVQECKADYAIIYLDTPLEVAVEWNKKRGEPIPNSLIDEVHYKLDEPGKEYKWDKPLIVLDPSQSKLQELAQTVATKIHEKVRASETLPAVREPSRLPSPRTDLDRETRRAMGEVMKRFKGISLAAQISELRKDVVTEALAKQLPPSEASRLFFERTESLLMQAPKEIPTGRVIVHVGLFGHVDHGKTKLAACLTEKPSTAALDKHPEAQRRGMTIDMGFSAFSLGKYLVTLVDLPGHYSLIKHVVGGANIIDLGILVIAADEGPSVQTIEHLQILDALNIERLVVAINKVDLVGEQRLAEVRNEVQALLEKTRFGGSPIACVSAIKCEGMENLRGTLLEQIRLPVRQWSGSLKIPVDHSFNIVGIGTVVTGTILRGKVKVGDVVEIRPTGKQCKVKLIQIFSENTQEAAAGDRVGIALADVRPKDLSRGYVLVSSGSLKERKLLDVKLHVEQNFKLSVLARSIVHINIGLQTVTGKIYPYTDLQGTKVIREKVDSGSVSQALIQLEKPIPAEVGDKALLMKLDLPPKQFRVIGLAQVTDLPEVLPEMYSAKARQGIVNEKASDDLYAVSGLFQTAIAAQHVSSTNVITATKIKGTIVGPYGDKGEVLVRFENPPSISEKVYYYKLRNARIG
jgi:selenocysteine-specific elongation factor